MIDLTKALEFGELQGVRYRLALPRHAPRGAIGARLGNRPGSSLEFMDHRDYRPGDDIRRIDWSAYARSDRLTLKLYREEVNPHVDLILDGSRSMALAETQKAAGLLALAAILAQAARNAGFSHLAWLTEKICRPIENSSALPSRWQNLTFTQTLSPARILADSPPPLRPRAIRFFLSDMLFEDDPMLALAPLARDAAHLCVVQLLARADAQPPQRGNLQLRDSESNQVLEIYLDAGAQKRYRDNLARHQHNWRRACRQLGAGFVTIIAEDLLEAWDLSELLQQQVLELN